MDYEKKYKETLEKVKGFLKRWEDVEEANPFLVLEEVKDIFPEFKESEDEKIRKEIIAIFEGKIPFTSEEDSKRYIAWLEKLKVFAEHGDGLYYFGNNGFTYVDNPTYDNVSWLEKQGEQEPANKVEPKFKIGYWITIDKPCQIISISDTGNYIVRYCDNEKTHILSKNFCESYFHLWTINNAEDGDMLTVNGRPFIYCCYNDYQGNYCCIDSDGKFRPNLDFGFNGKTILPATKEQRDLLFSKMKEAGYEWDAKDKELKKTETKGGEKWQKSM